MTMSNDTIAAIATGAPGAIGILRLSGPRAVLIAEKCFQPLGRKGLTEHGPRELVYGSLLDREGRPIDRVLCTYSLAHSSYTGEDTAELHCHGSPMVLRLGLEALFAQGARQAGPGEFTRRAFLNGRLDLTQAEAVADLIDARTHEGALQAAGQLGGALSRRIEEIYSRLTDLMAHFHAVLDYPDEDIDPFRAETIRAALEEQEQALAALLDAGRRGQAVKDGIPCAIVGRPNAGKSSLLNALVGYDRSIVTDIPGTTRDTVEERCRLGGVTLRLIDTAGLRESADPVERLGVERSRAAIAEAGLILAVVDGSAALNEEDREVLRAVSETGTPWIFVASKKDLVKNSGSMGAIGGDTPSVELSALTGEGLDRLEEAVAALFPQNEALPWGELLANARQEEAAGRALASVRLAREGLEADFTPDAVLTDVEQALAALGELTGRNIREDITQRIFERFCVGK